MKERRVSLFKRLFAVLLAILMIMFSAPQGMLEVYAVKAQESDTQESDTQEADIQPEELQALEAAAIETDAEELSEIPEEEIDINEVDSEENNSEEADFEEIKPVETNSPEEEWESDSETTENENSAEKKAISSEMFTTEPIEYTGMARRPKISGSDGEVFLEKDKHFEIVGGELGYHFCVKAYTKDVSELSQEYISVSENKVPYVEIRGIGEYEGTVKVPYNILPKKLTVSMLDTDTLIQEWINGGVTEDYGKDIILYDNMLPTYDKKLEYGTDYEVKSLREIGKAGTHSIEIIGKGNYDGSIKQNLLVKAYELKESDIVLGKLETDGSFVKTSSWTYAASAIRPAVKVVKPSDKKNLGGSFIPVQNYSVRYGKNTDAGINSGTITITGRGNCKGSVTVKFNINTLNLSNPPSNVSIEVASIKAANYSGKTVAPVTTIKAVYKNSETSVRTIILRAGTDYSIEPVSSGAEFKNRGSYPVLIKGNGNYSGSKSGYSFDINPMNISDGAVSVELLKQSVATARLKLSINKQEIPGSQYTYDIKKTGTNEVVSLGNIDPGLKYDVTVKLNNTCNFTKLAGEIVKTKVPVLTDISAGGVIDVQFAPTEPASHSYEYDGREKKPAVIVTSGGKELPKNAYVVSYRNNTEVGTASVVVTGKGSYSGEKALGFSITQKSVKAIISNVKAVTYNGNTQLQKPVVKASYVGTNGRETFITLREGRDYTIGYSGNRVDASQKVSSMEKPKVSVNISGNYSISSWEDQSGMTTAFTYAGNNCTKTFEINPVNITSARLAEKPYYYDNNGFTMTPKVKVMYRGIELSSSEYTVSQYDPTDMTNKQAVTVTPKIGTNYNINRPLIIRFKVSKKPLSELNSSELTYTETSFDNTAKTPTFDLYKSGIVSNVKITDGLKISYTNNIKAGKAKVTVTADKNNPYYCGSLSKSFTILPVDISTLGIDNSYYIQPRNYNTRAQTIAVKDIPTIIHQDEPYKSSKLHGLAYILNSINVSYRNNKEPGVAYIILSGKGNYTGSVAVPFVIGKASMRFANVTVGKTVYSEEYGMKIAPVVKVEVGGRKLRENTDYTISYESNVSAGKNALYVNGIGKYMETKTVLYINR